MQHGVEFDRLAIEFPEDVAKTIAAEDRVCRIGRAVAPLFPFPDGYPFNDEPFYFLKYAAH